MLHGKLLLGSLATPETSRQEIYEKVGDDLLQRQLELDGRLLRVIFVPNLEQS